MDEKQESKGEVLTYHTVTIGTGLVGIAAALTALRNRQPNEKVGIVGDRLDELGLREQILHIDEDVMEFVTELVGHELVDQYKNELTITRGKQSGFFISTGDLESLLHTALKNKYQEGVDYDLIQSKKIEANQKSTDAIQVDEHNSTISIQALSVNGKKGADPTTELHFKYLVAADGTKRSIAKSLGEKEVIFDSTQKALAHTKHMVAIFRIPEHTSPQDCINIKVVPNDSTGAEKRVLEATSTLPRREIDPYPIGKLRSEFGWKTFTRPDFRVHAARDILYLGTEIPDHLTKKQAKEYALIMLRDQLPQEYIDRIREVQYDTTTPFGKKQDQLKISIFDIELGDLNRTVKVTENPEKKDACSILFFMGDSRKSPLYTTGTGAQTGLKEVKLFNAFLEAMAKPDAELAASLTEYHAHARATLDSVGQIQDKWIEWRKQKIQEAERNFALLNKHNDTIKSLMDLIDAVDKLDVSGAEDTAPQRPEDKNPVRDFLNELQDNLKALEEKYKKTLDCYAHPDAVTNYNGVKVIELLNAFREMRQDLLAKYPELYKDKKSQFVISDIYKQLTSLLPSDQKPDMFFNNERVSSNTQPSPASKIEMKR